MTQPCQQEGGTVTAPILFTCHVDAEVCEVADAVSQLCLRPGSRAAPRVRDAFEHIADCLPCARCREAQQAVDGLKRTRFGKHERNILMYSPGPEAPVGAILDPDLNTHSDRETYLRAVRKLSKAGLLTAGRRFVRVETAGTRRDGTSVSRTYAHRTLQQTELGALVVEHYRTEMETGRAIRWGRHIDKIRSEARWSTEELLPPFADALEKRLTELAERAEGKDGEARAARQVRYIVQPIHEALRAAGA